MRLTLSWVVSVGWLHFTPRCTPVAQNHWTAVKSSAEGLCRGAASHSKLCGSITCPRKSVCSLAWKQLFKGERGRIGASTGNAGEGSALLLAMPVKKLGCYLPCAHFPRGSPREIAASLFCEFPVCEAGHEEGPLRQGLWLCQSVWRPLSFLHGTVASFASFWTPWHLVLLASNGLSPGRPEWSCRATKTPPRGPSVPTKSCPG